MTESEWWACQQPQVMLTFLRDSRKLSERKARLFAVACCRRIWHLLTDPRSREAVELTERFADGKIDREVLQRASVLAAAASVLADQDTLNPRVARLHEAAGVAAWSCSAFLWGNTIAAAVAAVALAGSKEQARQNGEAEGATQAVLVRDIFGPWPFRGKPTIAEGVLAFDNGCVVKLAAGIYEGRDFSQQRLGVLADALEEAGVTDEVVLGHCRREGAAHVRGCWLVDLLLGKE
jgi:hypothetical protein